MSSTTSTPNIAPVFPDRPYVDNDGRSDAERYLTDILDGRITACQYMKQFANIMLPRISDGYKDWHFDIEKAVRPVRFIEKFCRIPAGKRANQPFILEPYERTPIELAFGFVDDNLIREFRQVLLQWARKCGKTSTLAALNVYMLTSDGEKGAEVYNCATSEAQARLCYGATDSMIRANPMLSKRIRRGMVQKRGVSGLNYDKNGSFLVSLSSNVNRLDGLSTSFAVVDELGAFVDNGALLDLIEESTSAREQPLIWIISTENYVRNNIYDIKKDYAIGWLDGKIHDDRFMPMLYQLDNRDEIFKEECWIKANPGLGVTKSIEYLRDKVNRSKQSPNVMPSLLTKEFNLRSGAYSAYFDIEECVNNTPIDFPISDVPYCVVGIDNAMRGDLASAVARFMRPGDDNIYEIARFWIPEKSIEINSAKDIKERDHVPYRQWAADGWVDIEYGADRINQMVFLDFMRELIDTGIYVFAVAYDAWHIEDWLDKELRRLVGDSRVFAVPQTARVISPLMQEHKLDLKARKVICPNPVLHWNRLNTQSRRDNNGNDFVQKRDLDHHNKVDGLMAELFSAYCLGQVHDNYLNAIEWYPPEDDEDSSNKR